MAKADNIEMEKRMADCIEVVINEGMQRKDFLRYASDKWEVSERQAETYWKRVWDFVAEKYSKENHEIVDEHVRQLWRLYNLCVKKKDYQTSRGILQDLAKLKGINEPDKKDITSGGESIKIIIGVDEDDD